MYKQDSTTDWGKAAFPGPGQQPFTEVVISGLAPSAQLSPELVKAIHDHATEKPTGQAVILVDTQLDFSPANFTPEPG